MTTRAALTPKQLTILRLIADGHTNAQIGARLYLAEDTVKTHNRQIFRKLDARDRAHAVHIGHQAGLLT